MPYIDTLSVTRFWRHWQTAQYRNHGNGCVTHTVRVLCKVGVRPRGGFVFSDAGCVSVWIVAARSQAWVCGRSPAGIVGSNPTGGIDVLSVVSAVCCQAVVSATDW